MNGICNPYGRDTVAINGPKMKPKPKDAPMRPNPFARSFSDVVSEITAEATEIFPDVKPSRARARNRKRAFGANAAIKNEIAVPISEMSKSGFLPYLSESLPITGVAKNWQREKIANNIPFWKSFNPNCLE